MKFNTIYLNTIYFANKIYEGIFSGKKNRILKNDNCVIHKCNNFKNETNTLKLIIMAIFSTTHPSQEIII